MKKISLSFFSLLMALTTVPFSTFAMRTHHDTGEVIFWAVDTFCENASSYGYNCAKEEPYIFTCDRYVPEWNSDHNLQIAWRHFNHLLKIACDDESGLMFSYVEDVDYDMFSNKIIAVKCLPGYKHPDSSVSNFQFKCIEDSRYSDEYRDEKYNSFMGLTQTTTTATTPAATKTTPTPTPAVSKSGGATQKKIATPPRPTTNTHTQTTPESTANLREPLQEYETQPVDTTQQNTESAQNSDTKQKKGLCTNTKEHHLLAKYVDGVCTVESCVAGYDLVDNTCVKKEKPVRTERETPVRTETEENSDAKQKKGLCTNAKEHHLLAKYVDGVCTVESCVAGYDLVDNTCVKKEKPVRTESAQNSDAKQKKGLCTNAKEHHLLAKYVDGVCTVESCVVGYELVDNVCVKKEKPAKTGTEENSDAKQKKGLCTNAKEHHLLAKYVDGVCTVESCVVGYEVSEDKKSCVKKDNSAKAESKLEKELEKDINTLTKEFLSVVKSITKTCEKSGGSITDGGECVVPENTEDKSSRSTGRSAGAKAKKGKK